MIYAPVIIPTLCRYEHFKRCIESLSRCTGAEYTEVYVGLDFPAKDSHREGYNQIKEYLYNCGNLGFKQLHIIERTYNYGLGSNGNYATLKHDILEKYDRLISSEDDNEFAPCFLDYMNKALELYKDDDRVLSVAGYNHVKSSKVHTLSNIIFTPDTTAWGIGVWKDKEKLFNNLSPYYYQDLVFSLKKYTNIYKVYPDCANTLFNMIRRGLCYGDTKRTVFNIINNKYQIRPKLSLVRNHGFDGTGVHGALYYKDYATQEIDCNLNFTLSIEEPNLLKEVKEVLYYSGLRKNKLMANFSIVIRYVNYFIFYVLNLKRNTR